MENIKGTNINPYIFAAGKGARKGLKIVFKAGEKLAKFCGDQIKDEQQN